MNFSEISKYVTLIKELYFNRNDWRILLISGGGSYGHSVVREMDILDDLSQMKLIETNFRLKWIWVRALTQAGVPTYPLLFSSLASVSKGKLISSIDTVDRITFSKYIPITSGDCLIGNDNKLHIVGSDIVPSIFLQNDEYEVRVVGLTNEYGVLDARGDTILTVNQASVNDIAFWGGDTTGAMKGKVGAFLDHAKNGAECFIMHGDQAKNHPQVLLYNEAKLRSKLRFTSVIWSS